MDKVVEQIVSRMSRHSRNLKLSPSPSQTKLECDQGDQAADKKAASVRLKDEMVAVVKRESTMKREAACLDSPGKIFKLYHGESPTQAMRRQWAGIAAPECKVRGLFACMRAHNAKQLAYRFS